MKMATENHYPEGQIWDADGIKIPIGGMSFDGAKMLQKNLEINENDIIGTLCNLEEASIALYRCLGEAYDCNDGEIGHLLGLFRNARKSKAHGEMRLYDALNERLSQKSRSLSNEGISSLIANLQSRL